MSKAIHTCLRGAITVEDNKLAHSSCNDRDCPLNELRSQKKAEHTARPQSKLSNILTAG